MQISTSSIKDQFLKTFFLIICLTFLFFSCEEKIDDLWDSNNDTDSVSPLVGDWYADSIKSFNDCIKSIDDSDYETTDEIFERAIDNYNLWLLSDGSLQLVFDQTKNLQFECDTYYDFWSDETGCGDFSPLEFCNTWFEHNEYNIETTDCSQSSNLSGTWVVDEDFSIITLSIDSVCVNGWGNPSYISSENACNDLDESQFFPIMEKTFAYTLDNENGTMDFEGSWFDDDSSCVIFHMSLQ